MSDKTVQKIFVVGDSWLYYKLYCGVQTADRLLTNQIQVLTEKLLVEEKISKWFFMRYTDPEPHLRVRFLINERKDFEEIITIIKNHLAPLIETQQLWNMQLANYQRELERYGTHTITQAESFFFYDSRQIISMIQNVKDDEAYFLEVFWWIEQLILLFKLNSKQLLSFLDCMQQQFKKEFHVTQSVKKSLSKKYRILQPQLCKEISVISSHKEAIKEIVNELLLLNKEKQLEVSLDNLLASYIHLSINRSFSSQQRLYEMMFYDFLYKKYSSKLARHGSV